MMQQQSVINIENHNHALAQRDFNRDGKEKALAAASYAKPATDPPSIFEVPAGSHRG